MTWRAAEKRRAQRGFFLIEALVAILIFAIGGLGMVAIGGTATNAQSDARVRTEAATLAEELASDIVLNVNKTATGFQNSLLGYRYNVSGDNCAFSGGLPGGGDLASQAVVSAWLNRVTTVGPNAPGLPGSSNATVQVLVDTAATSFNRVQITVCWRQPNDQAMRQHTLVTYVNGLIS